jgi:diguanylate cyclase (GGDEF)-like protein
VADTENPSNLTELRLQIGRALESEAESIVGESIAVFPFTGPQPLDPDHCARICDVALRLLTAAVRDGGLQARSGFVADLRRLAQDRGIGPQQLFSLIYVVERTALDSLDDRLGASPDQWTPITQIVRRGSFDVLAAFAELLTQEPAHGALIDPLTTLPAGPVLESVLEKELHRAERLGHPFALIVFNVDRLADINAKRGYGFGDRVLERIGIVIRNYFREHDWVTRCSEDTFAILLPETIRANAESLAEGLRVTVEERLALRDYRTEEHVQVTVSVAVLIGDGQNSNHADAVLRQAEDAVERAKQAGRNRVEVVEIGGTRVPRPARARGV